MILLLLALYVSGIAGTEHTLDLEYHLKDTDSATLTEKDEMWSRKEKRTKPAAGAQGASTHSASLSVPAATLPEVIVPTHTELRSKGSVSSYALGLAPKARSDDTSEYDHKFARPRKGLVVSMINFKYEWTRPYDNSGSLSWMSGSAGGGNELWHFEQQLNEEEWIIKNAATSKVVECGAGDDYYLRLKDPSNLNNKMKFKFVEVEGEDYKGWYYIESIARPGAYIAADSDSRGLCWKPEEVHLCKEDGTYSGHCKWEECDKCQHGVRYSGAKEWCCHGGDLFRFNDCECDPTSLQSVTLPDGRPDKRFMWRFEDLFASSSAWDLIFEYSNARGCNAKKTLSITKGYSSTFESSTAVTIGAEYGISASASEGIKAAKFEESMEMKLSSEVSSSVTESSTSYVEETVETEFLIPAHSCMRYMQIQVTQKDTFTDKDLVFGSGVYQKEVYCNEDDPEFIGVPDETTCPPDQVIDITAEKAVGEMSSGEFLENSVGQESSVLNEAEEGLFIAAPETFEPATPFVVYGLAAVGLGAALHGARMHYTKAAEESFGETTPLEP